MAQNYIQPGDVLEITAGGTITSGSPVAIGAMAGVALGDATSGKTVRVAMEGVFELPKAAGAITIGAKLYLVVANGNLTTTVGSNIFIGHAVEAAADAGTTVKVRLAQA